MPNRVKAFVWLVAHKKIMSNVKRVRRGFVLDGSCKRCQGSFEDMDHIFRRCDVAKAVWEEFLPHNSILTLTDLIFDNWLMINLNGNVQCDFTNDLFAVILWWLWRWRNEFVSNETDFSIHYKVA